MFWTNLWSKIHYDRRTANYRRRNIITLLLFIMILSVLFITACNDDHIGSRFHKRTPAKDTGIKDKPQGSIVISQNGLKDIQRAMDQIMASKKRIDLGKGFVNDILKNNNRLEYYRLYIKLAKKMGYKVTTYYDYLKNYKDTTTKVLILRHDVDEKNLATNLMFDIEKEEGVKSTFYFRWKTLDLKLIRRISQNGFEVGLHYETIANYCLKHHTMKIGPKEISICRKLLKNEIRRFEAETGIDIKTIASHGNPINKKINIPNNILLTNQRYSDHGIVNETYDPNIMKNYISSYICDEDIMKGYGFEYKDNPIDSMLQNKKVIEFLSHPNHWYYTKSQRESMMKNKSQQ